MTAVEDLITENIDVWTSAIKRKSSAGRGGGKKVELYGVKKLRELILDLAVRGLLVPQDSEDEPAGVLLERIAAEQTELLKAKKAKLFPEISEELHPYKLPESWVYRRFGSVLDFSGGSQPPKNTFSEIPLDGYIQLIQIRDLGPKPQPVFVPEDKVSKFCTKDDIMIGRYGASVGKVFWGKDGAYNVALIKLHNDAGVYTQGFLYLLMTSPLGQSLFSGISRSAQAGFSKKDIEHRLLPVASHPEQNRIVAKVNELMALCDQLEQQTEASLTAHQTLVRTLLDALTQAATQSEENGEAADSTSSPFEQAWCRLAEHFDTIFTTEDSVEQLKQTILQLAVMGKLVPQDANDEPASELLKRIAVEKVRLVKTANLKTKASDTLETHDCYITTPSNWQWLRLGNVAKFIDYRGKTPTKIEDGVRLITAKNVRFGYLDIEPQEFISEDEYTSWMTRGFPKVGDILFTPEAPLGNVAIVELEEKFALAQRAICFQFHLGGLSEFIRLTIMSRFFQSQLIENATGMTATGIKASKLKEIPIPIPPLREQELIVAKVDELMTICEHLNARLTDAQATQLQLADAVTKQAVR